MRRLTLVVMFVGILLLMDLGCQAGNGGEAGKKVNLDSEKSKVSYAIGFNMGQSLVPIKEEIEIETLLQGLMDGAAGNKAQMTQEAIEIL